VVRIPAGRGHSEYPSNVVGNQAQYFDGSEMYASVNAESEVITSLVATGGNGPDGKRFPRLVPKDSEL
jgi:hypothetical protein